MRRVIRPGEKKDIIIETVSGEQDVDTLLTKSYLVLQREIQNLVMESSKGKLNSGSSKDLVAYIKLLNDIKLEEAEFINSLPTEVLNEAITKGNK